MSREIRRLHRKQTPFTNFSSSQATELPSPTESIEQNITDTSDKPFRRRRRRPPSDFPADTNLPNSTESTEQNISDNSKAISAVPAPINTNDINAIRAEFREDTYHSNLAESDYSNDTHDWGGDNPYLSNDYWHFLGRYE